MKTSRLRRLGQSKRLPEIKNDSYKQTVRKNTFLNVGLKAESDRMIAVRYLDNYTHLYAEGFATPRQEKAGTVVFSELIGERLNWSVLLGRGSSYFEADLISERLLAEHTYIYSRASDLALASPSKMSRQLIDGAFYGHLIFLSWALITNWSPSAYFFYNILFLILLLWGIAAKGNVEPLEMAQIVNIISLVLDIFVVSIFFPRSGIGVKMSACMAIINILIRPVTLSILRNEIRYRRDGGTGSHYQDIDSTPGTP
uniref:Uncharacterized protein n=1 Tax=Rhodnius prolixus TaxID=13249 RepID=T1IDS6_RHOPR